MRIDKIIATSRKVALELYSDPDFRLGIVNAMLILKRQEAHDLLEEVKRLERMQQDLLEELAKKI